MIHCPEGYVPLSFCTECGRDFSGDSMFDKHRVGVHEYTYSQGLKFDPPREDGRRCLTTEEMLFERSWRFFTDEEMLESKRDKHRVGFGIELWFDISEAERMARRRDEGLFKS